MKKGIRLFATLMVCMAMALCVSCKKDDDNNEPGGGGGGDLSGKTLKYYVAEFDDSAGQIYETTERIIFNSTTHCDVDRHGYDWVYYDEWEKDYWSDNYSTTYTYDGTRLVVKGYVLMWDGSRVDKTFINKGGYFEGDGGEEFFFDNTGGGGGGTGGGGTIAGHDYVDLGLPSGLLWATCNVGADKPEDYGDYFAWGETETKSTYNWNTYKWYNGSHNTLTKYNTDSDYGTVDNKTVLDPEDDAARANWGGDWRMPTYDEIEELKDNCTSEWTTQNGVNGRKFTGPNGESIFLPAAGDYYHGTLYYAGSRGLYWSGSLGTDHPRYAFDWYFLSGGVYMGSSFRYYGFSVRPVCPSQK